MASSSLSHCSFVLIFSLFLFSLYIGGVGAVVADRAPPVTYHSGPILSGTHQLIFIWYGKFDEETKRLLSTFVESLNINAEDQSTTQLSQWWKVVQNFQKAAGKSKDPVVHVKLSKQVVDDNYSIGKNITMDSVKPLVQNATGNSSYALPIIFTDKDVTVDSLCSSKCSEHGLLDNQPYVVVGSPENKCVERCAWLFMAGNSTVPPNGSVGRDALVSVFAQALVNVVTNPQNSGFYQDKDNGVIEDGVACNGHFGNGPTSADVGRVRIDPVSKIIFNAYGAKGNKFLLPALFNLVIRSCWTLM